MTRPTLVGEIGPRTDAETMCDWAWVHYLQALTPAERYAWGQAYEALDAVRSVSREVQHAEHLDYTLG